MQELNRVFSLSHGTPPHQPTVFGTSHISIANCNFTMVGSGCFHNRFSSTEAKLFSRGPTPHPPETNRIVVDPIVSIPISNTSTISRKIIFTPQSTLLPQAGDQTIGDLLNDVYIDLAERGWSRRLQLIRSLDPLGGGAHNCVPDLSGRPPLP